MRKKLLGIAFIAMTCVAFSGAAQNNKSDKNNCPAGATVCSERTVCPEENCNERNVCPEGAKVCNGVTGKVGRQECGRQCPFEGLNLTDAQKTQLKQLQEKRAAERKQKAQAGKREKQLKDSARRADRHADRKSYLEEVKAIVGPDKYVLFLENFYVNGGNNHMKAFKGRYIKGDGKGKAFRHGRKEVKFNRDTVRGDRPIRLLDKKNK